MVGVVISPVRIAVFKENVAVLPEIVVSGTASGSCIQIENNGIVRSFTNPVEKAPEIILCLLRGYLEPIYLEYAYAVFFPEADDRLGVLLPIGEVVLHAWIIPEANLHPECSRTVHHRVQPAGILDRIRSPVIGVVPDVPERTLCYLGIRALAALPSVIDLENGDSESGGQFQFTQAEFLVHLGILAAVAPCIHHNNIQMEAVCLLPGPHRAQRCQFSRAEYSGNAAVEASPLILLYILRKDACTSYLETAEVCGEITGGVAQLHIGAGRLLQEEEAIAGDAVPHEKQVTLVAKLAIGDEILLLHEVVVPVGHVPETHRLPVPVRTRKAELVKNGTGNGL